METPIISMCVSAKKRVYYIDAHVDRKGQHYISLSEIPKDNKPGMKVRQRVFIHADYIDEVLNALSEVSNHIKESGYENH